LEHESHQHHHPHGTGIRWLDISLAVAAGVVSLVSLWLALHSAHSMEKLVASNSYPYVELARNMSSVDKDPETGLSRKRVEYILINSGIGPARVEWVQLMYKGKPMADLSQLLEACCAMTKENFVPMNRRGNVVNSLVRPGDIMSMFAAEEPRTPNPVFDALHRSMRDIELATCYCSVFDECYLRNDDAKKPEPVEQCTAPKVTFRPDFKT
jgi:hypothetical protein